MPLARMIETMDDRQPQAPAEAPIPPDRSLVPYEQPGRKASGFFQRIAQLFRPGSGLTTRENLQGALAASYFGDQTISDDERAMLHNILRLRDLRVVDVMVPRAEIEAVDIETSLGDLLLLFESSGHSRMPVYAETLDDPRGMVHIRDVVAFVTKTGRKRTRRKRNADGELPPASVSGLDLAKVDLGKTIGELKLMRNVLFVPPSMLASDLMGRMQAQRIQMALVIDEYGGTDGLVSLEDIVEMVVGDIEDEHDETEVQVQQQDENTFIVDARTELAELGPYLGDAFVEAARTEDEDVDTVGGLIFSLLGRVPVRGEVLPSFAGHEFEVIDADPRRIKRLRIMRVRHGSKRAAPRKDSTDPATASADERAGVPADG